MAEGCTIEFKNQMTEVGRVNQDLTDFLEARAIPLRVINTINLAFEELATNIVKYSYDDAAEHRIQVSIRLEPESLTLALTDDGHEFNPLQLPEVDLTAPIEERGIGGLGIHLVKKSFDHLAYERREGKNIFTVTKKLIPHP